MSAQINIARQLKTLASARHRQQIDTIKLAQIVAETANLHLIDLLVLSQSSTVRMQPTPGKAQPALLTAFTRGGGDSLIANVRTPDLVAVYQTLIEVTGPEHFSTKYNQVLHEARSETGRPRPRVVTLMHSGTSTDAYQAISDIIAKLAFSISM